MREFLFLAVILSIVELSWYSAHAADQQTTKDDGVSFSQGLLGDVQAITSNTTPTPATVPGFAGTNIPMTDYYNNQDPTGMQTDAVVGITTGTANEASLFAMDQALVPKLSFGPTDPILTNANTISTDAILTPEVITVRTGSCEVTNVSSVDKSIENCTAWMIPTNHFCSKTLDVNVKWDDVSNCPIGTGFNEGSAYHITGGFAKSQNDYTYARAYCNPGVPDGQVAMQVHASDNNASQDCTGWTQITASTNQPSLTYTGVNLRPSFHEGFGCSTVHTFAQGSCSGTQCNYAITFYEGLSNFYINESNDAGDTPSCTESRHVNLTSTGLYNGLVADMCFFRKSVVPISFEKPAFTRTPTVTETWNNGCTALEAQL